MTLSIIVAMTEDRVIGINNRLPWHLSEDLKRFKQITMGHPIIMGRKTYESIGKPLPGRRNIVLTHDVTYVKEGIDVFSSLPAALKACADEAECFVIGGAAVFVAALPLTSKIYLTLIRKKFEGDTFFPMVDLERGFVVEKKEDGISAADKIPYTFINARRK